MNILIAALLAPPTVLAVILLVNRITFPRLGRAPGRRPSVDWPSVSILVPARDEAGGIDATLSGLLAMDYPGRLEVLVLDDQSQDATAQIVQAHAAADARLRLLDGRPLPSGWAGKNWACHQLAGQAAGEILVFTDADVAWSTPALTRVIAYLDQLQADMFTVWPTQITHSWGDSTAR